MTAYHAIPAGLAAIGSALQPSARILRALSLGALALLPAAAALAQEGSATQEFTVPNTNDYLLLGLGIVGLILGIWVIRMVVRFRTLHQDEATLESLEDETGGVPLSGPGAPAESN